MASGRVIGRIESDESERMTQFALTAQTARWCVVGRGPRRYCARRGPCALLHRTRPNVDREVIRKIYCQNDVDRGYLGGEKLLIVNWEENLERWRSGDSSR